VAFALTGILWPALLVTIALQWPGPGQSGEYYAPGAILPGPSSLPPVDRSGSLMHLVIKYDPASASAEVYVDGQDEVPVSRIFWELPQTDNDSGLTAGSADSGDPAADG